MHQGPSIDAFKLLRHEEEADAALIVPRIAATARVRFRVAQALAQGRMSFHFQPVVRADDPTRPAFFEMLARLRMPDGQVLTAGSFLPEVEKGLLGRVTDRLALTHALAMLGRDPSLRLSINLSPLSMGDEEWLAILAAAARSGSGVCGRLILEVTENAAIENADQTIEFMNHVRKSGCAFALDDFGAGATGFRHFRDFRFDMVKIDGTFVRDIHHSADAKVLIECLMSVAQHFEMFTIAEFVETEADAAWLRQKGVDCFQGYLYGRPSPVPVLEPARTDKRAAG